MPTFAAVDIGSNSVRLKIAKVVRGRLQALHEDREVTRLGESVFANGALDPQAMALTIRVLKRFHRAVQDYAADRVRVVATAALRDSRNSRAFLDWVRSATGWKAEVITGLEEGRLIHLGLVSNAGISRKRALLHHFGTLKEIERASIADLGKVPGVSAESARKIFEFFHAQTG